MLVDRGRRLGEARARRRVGRAGQLRRRRRDQGTRPADDRYATITNGPAGETGAEGSRHRGLRHEGLPEPLRRPRRPRRRHGQQGPEGDRRLRQGLSAPRARRQGSVQRRDEGSRRRSRSTPSPARACRPTARTSSPTSCPRPAACRPATSPTGSFEGADDDRRRDASARSPRSAAGNVDSTAATPAASSSARATGSTRTATT